MGIAVKEMANKTALEAPEIELRDLEDETPSLPFVYGCDEEGYLTSDGQLMAENAQHHRENNNSIESLDAHFLSRSDAYVAGCDFLHYQQGDRTKYISPDCYAVFGVTKLGADGKIRMNFKIWEERNHAPSIIFEFTSNKTKAIDLGAKFVLYERTLRTPEYILFDPLGQYLDPPLKGYRLNAAGRYEAIPVDENGRIYSEQLDLYLEERQGSLRFFDKKTGEYLRTPAEAEQQRIQEARARQQADIRAEKEAQRAERATQRAEQETQRAEQETRLRLEAEARTAALLAELEALRRQQGS